MKFERIEKLSENQIQQLHQLFQNERWTKGRKLLNNTDYIFAFQEQELKSLAGFARVINDRVFKALILDVIVAPVYQKCGLGTELMEMILHHPQLKQVKNFELNCLPELIPFYERWGFSTDKGGVVSMQRKNIQS
jgi:predicted GNAT family N-acyltransferase